jgi:hypothetical protein
MFYKGQGDSGLEYAVIRGDFLTNPVQAGIYSLYMDYFPSLATPSIVFRCVID